MSTLNQQVVQAIEAQRDSLAQAIVESHYRLQPELAQRYGNHGRDQCLKDAHYHLTYLSEAIVAAHPSLFANYVAWAKVLLAGLGISSTDLANNLQVMREVLTAALPDTTKAIIEEYIQEGLNQLPNLPSELPTYLETSEPYTDLAKPYLEMLLRGERQSACRLILDAVNRGVGVKDIYLHVFQSSQYEIGRLWQMNKISVAQEHYCTAATQLIMSQLYPYIFATNRLGRTLVASCIGGDLHEMGIRMVADFFEMAGWDTFYLGANTPTVSILQELEERYAEVLAISATMTFHISAVANLITAVRSHDRFRHVKILVGGYPFNVAPTLWKQLGADAFARNANEAIEIAEQLWQPHLHLPPPDR